MRHQARIDELRKRISAMGRDACSMVEMAIAALGRQNLASVPDEILAKETGLDQLQVDLDRDAIGIIATFNPVAHNLRFLLTATRVTSELERVGDQAVNICSYGLITGLSDASRCAIEEMSAIVGQMLESSLIAFEQQDAELAIQTIVVDDRLDELERAFSIRMLEQSASLPDRMTALLIGQALERIGDQATNICEDVIFAVNGKDVRHSSYVNLLDTRSDLIPTRMPAR